MWIDLEKNKFAVKTPANPVSQPTIKQTDSAPDL